MAFSSLHRAVHDIVVGFLQTEREPQVGSGSRFVTWSQKATPSPRLYSSLTEVSHESDSTQAGQLHQPALARSQTVSLNEGFYIKVWTSRALDHWTLCYMQPATR